MPQPATGLTFLFTDIEGSTARWEQQREAMAGEGRALWLPLLGRR